MSTSIAVPMAPGILFTNQVTLVVMLTDAVACSPSRPTMAVSTYCSSVASTSSIIVGTDSHSRVRSNGIYAGLFN